MTTDTRKVVTADERGRAHLGPSYANRLFLRRECTDGTIILEPAEVVPRRKVLPDRLIWSPQDGLPDTAIYLGDMDVDGDRVPYAWDPAVDPHIRFAGSTGSGSTCLAATVVAHLLDHPDQGRCTIIDPKGTDYTWAVRQGGDTRHHAIPTTADIVDLYARAAAVIRNRQHQLVKKIRAGEPRPEFQRVFLVLDLFDQLQEQLSADLSTAAFREAAHNLSTVIRSGHELGISVVTTGHTTPRAPWRELDDAPTVLLGNQSGVDAAQCGMPAADHRTDIPGRGLLRVDEYTYEFQAAYRERPRP